MARQLRRPSGAMGDKVGMMMNKANEALYDFTLTLMQPAAGQSILEIGYGNGKFFDKLFSKAANLELTGIDFSAAMFAAAKKNNKDHIASGRLQLHAGNSESMPFADNSFDKIFCINVIYFWDEPHEHLAEIYRVLKSGGQLYATIRTRESMLKMSFTKYGFSFYDAEKWKALAQQASLQHKEAILFDEPPVEFEGKNFSIQSLCLVSIKEN